MGDGVGTKGGYRDLLGLGISRITNGPEECPRTSAAVRMPNTEGPASRFHPNAAPGRSTLLLTLSRGAFLRQTWRRQDGDMEYGVRSKHMEVFYPGGPNMTLYSVLLRQYHVPFFGCLFTF